VGPDPDPSDQVFNYTYILPAYLLALAMFIGVGSALDPSFIADHAGTTDTPGPLRLAASKLLNVHSMIQSAITRLQPTSGGSAWKWTVQDLYNMYSTWQNGDDSYWPGITYIWTDYQHIVNIEYAAVEIYSGASSMADYKIAFDVIPDFRSGPLQ
jgi:hypothetical protein